ncbi:MAG: LysR family transcriptional regulator [Tepidibacter sp.]|jgi:DNA-binding transcriptional LysR family regulator|uniref:LysR family transcriptional regulator n=1 Tax=Tepidibacter sp. TaxID=2529387 RepID=UPI0025EB4742|nr:LysR family transcriptional regulator [Tepidibacter sp.]MCT4507798.1 LysR family transcriptional regulator [Tepidibacter sp.]
MDIRNFITFNTIVDTGGFTKAAIRLNYAQSTVTLHIKELETHYNERLFDRMGKRIFLTSFGTKLHEKSKRLVEEYKSILEMNNKDQTCEVLRIGIYESLLKYRMYDIIHEYKTKYPHVDMIIHHGTCKKLRDMVRNGELDLTFQIESSTEFSGFNVDVLCEEKFSLILPKNNKIDILHKSNQTIYLTEKGCSYRMMFEDFLNNQGIIPEHIMETGFVDMIKQYVSFGLGYSMVPTITVTDEKDKEELEVLDFSNESPMYTQLVYHKEKYIFSAMEAFIKLVKYYAKNWN